MLNPVTKIYPHFMVHIIFVFSVTSLIFVLILFPRHAYINATPAAQQTLDAYDSCPAPVFPKVTHFFTHALIAYPEKAFEKDNFMRSSYDADCLTVSEFKGIINGLYENGYALIDINSVFEIRDGKAYPKSFAFPKGKKPLILSFDDMNYYKKKMHLGMNDKLIVSNGRLATYTSKANPNIDYDNETVTVLENFIGAHPDFSFCGARATLCLTGFDGVLGYRTEKDSPDRETEIKAARPVIQKLKDLGYNFACHSYGHYHMKKLSAERFATDTLKWKKEVEPLIGNTGIYVYPYGEWDLSLSKHSCLSKAGFGLFLGVGKDDYYSFLKKGEVSALFMDRKPLDGFSLRYHRKFYSEYFDVAEVYDSVHRYIKLV